MTIQERVEALKQKQQTEGIAVERAVDKVSEKIASSTSVANLKANLPK
jgi:hypothetical protein